MRRCSDVADSQSVPVFSPGQRTSFQTQVRPSSWCAVIWAGRFHRTLGTETLQFYSFDGRSLNHWKALRRPDQNHSGLKIHLLGRMSAACGIQNLAAIVEIL